jgi:hypothetical protein
MRRHDLLNYLQEGGFPTLLRDTLKDFGSTAYQGTRHMIS